MKTVLLTKKKYVSASISRGETLGNHYKYYSEIVTVRKLTDLNDHGLLKDVTNVQVISQKYYIQRAWVWLDF